MASQRAGRLSVIVDLVKTFRFEAAHRTPWGNEKECLHGHSYNVEIEVSGEVDSYLGWLMDYAGISSRFDGLYRTLDHHTLNDVAGLEDPGLPGVAQWLNQRLAQRIEGLKEVRVSILGDCAFKPRLVDPPPGGSQSPRLRFGFEAAHALLNLPMDHKCFRMHGHSFTVELEGTDPESLQQAAKGIYDQLDHRSLNDLQGLENPTSEQIARWIWDKCKEEDCELNQVVVAETCTARCIYRGK